MDTTTPVTLNCSKCERIGFSSKSGLTLHEQKCTGPIKKEETDTKCPQCGRSDFSSGSGRTLHIKSCKGTAQKQKLEEPCPKCGNYDFNSLSGRTLHINACKADQPEERKDKPVVPINIAEKEWPCPYCHKDIFGFEKKFILHLNECYPIIKNTAGHILDKKLNVWIVKAPAKCYCPSEILKALKCWPPKLGIFMSAHHDIRDQTGCWLEGIGQCIYSYDAKTQKRISNNGIGDPARIHGEMTGEVQVKIEQPKLSIQEEQTEEQETEVEETDNAS